MNVKVVNASWDLKRVGRSPLAGKGGGKTFRGVRRARAKAVGREVVGLAKAFRDPRSTVESKETLYK